MRVAGGQLHRIALSCVVVHGLFYRLSCWFKDVCGSFFFLNWVDLAQIFVQHIAS